MQTFFVEVRAPLKAAKTQIYKFVASKEDWIVTRLDKHEELAGKREAFNLNYGEKMLYRGKEYPIIARPSNRIGFDKPCTNMKNRKEVTG